MTVEMWETIWYGQAVQWHQVHLALNHCFLVRQILFATVHILISKNNKIILCELADKLREIFMQKQLLHQKKIKDCTLQILVCNQTIQLEIYK